jgi:cell division protein FtsL
LVNSSSTSRSNSSDGIVSLPIKFDVKYPAKIGIGNFDQLSYIFSVEDIKPSTSKTFEKLLSVSLKNQGNIPMIFMGQARMVSVDFSNLSFGPYTFRSKTTDPKSERVVNILLPRDLPEGSYRIFVDVNNGKRSSQSVREVTLLFEKPTSLKEKLLLTFIFVAAALILSIAIFYLYRGVLPPFLLQIRHLLKTTKSRDNDNTQYQKELHTNSDLPRFGHLNDKSNSVSSIFVDETDRVPKTSVARKGSVKVSKKKRAIKKQTRSPRRPSR